MSREIVILIIWSIIALKDSSYIWNNNKIVKCDFETKDKIIIETNEFIEVTDDEIISENNDEKNVNGSNVKNEIQEETLENIQKEKANSKQIENYLIQEDEEIKNEPEETSIEIHEPSVELKQEFTTDITISEEQKIVEETVDNYVSVQNKEEYRTNEMLISKMIDIINQNQNEEMIQYGYKVIQDETIISLTNPFTFSEQRLKNKIQNGFGTIRVYARDYYLNDTYIETQCYIY